MTEDEELEFQAAMNEFEAIVTDAVAISAFDGHVRLAPGTYMVSLEHDERGAPDGARLVRSSRVLRTVADLHCGSNTCRVVARV